MSRYQLALILVFSGCLDTGADETEDDTAWDDGKADSATTGALRVTEVHAHPKSSANAFVELIDASTNPIDLTTCTLSIGTRKLHLVAVDGRAHVVAPQQLAVIIDDDRDPSDIPADAVVVTLDRDLGDLLRGSQRLLLRVAGTISDRADASKTPAAADVSLERTLAGAFAPSSLGNTPGGRNAIHGPAIAVYFANPPVDTVDPIAPHLVTVIDGAKQSLDAAFFQVNNPALIAAFVGAKKRGVAIRLVTDTDYFADPAYAPGYQTLIAAGIPVVDDKRSALMHSKFMIVDHQAVWTGSYNLLGPDGTTFDHADNAFYLQSPAVAAIHQDQFEQLFGRVGGAAKHDAGNHDVFVDGVHFEVYFAPTDHLYEHTLATVQRGTKTIHFVAFSFFQRELGAALVQAFGTKLDVRGVFDNSSVSAGTQFPPLVAAGLDVRNAGPDVFLHDKFFVIDAALPTATVVTGSPNFSINAYNTNDEAMYIVHDRAIAAQYETAFHVFYDRVAGPNTPATVTSP